MPVKKLISTSVELPVIVYQACVWEKAVHLAVASDVFDGVFLCCPFYNEMSWMRSGIELSQFSFLLFYA